MSVVDLSNSIAVLAIDGGPQVGMVNAQWIDSLEQEAYKIGTEEFCIPANRHHKVSVSELYDYVAGTQTGSLYASMLTLRHKDDVTPMYYASDVKEFFTRKGGRKLLAVNRMFWYYKFLTYIGVSTLFAFLGFLFTSMFCSKKEDNELTVDQVLAGNKNAMDIFNKSSSEQRKNMMEKIKLRLQRKDNEYTWRGVRITSCFVLFIFGIFATHYAILDWILKEYFPANSPKDLF
jgi:hypothetical protein